MKTRPRPQPMLPFADDTGPLPEVVAMTERLDRGGERGDDVANEVADPIAIARMDAGDSIAGRADRVSTSSNAVSRAWPAAGRTWIAAACPEVALLAVAVVLFGLWIGRAPLLDPDEARYAAASREMLDRGDLVVPHYNGAERLNKPVFFYWLQTAAFRLVGPSETAARLPSIVAALLAVLVVYGFARRVAGRPAALRAAAILMSCPLFVMVGKIGITDMTLCLFVTAALVSWYRYLVGIGDPRLNWVATSLSLGLAFFVKGPVGVLLPCLVVAVFLAVRGEWRRALKWKPLLGGAVLAGAVVLPWGGLLVYRLGKEASREVVAAGAIGGPTPHASAILVDRTGAASAGSGSASALRPARFAVPSPPALPETLLLGIGRVGALLRRETIDRAVTGLEHPRSFTFYLPAMFVVFLPWSFYLPFALGSAATRLRKREPAILFLAIWFAVVLIVFSLVKGKLVTYILPAAPPLALFLALVWPCRMGSLTSKRTSPMDAAEAGPAYEIPTRASRSSDESSLGVAAAIFPRVESVARGAGWTLGGALCAAAAMVTIIGLAYVGVPSWLAPYRFEVWGFALLVALAGLVPILARRPSLSTYTVAGAMMLAIAVLPANAGRNITEKRSLRALASETMAPERTWSRVIAYQLPRPSLVFYGHRTIEMAGSLHDLRRLVEPDALVFMEERRFQGMPAGWRDAFRVVATQDDVLALSPIAPLPDRTSQSGTLGRFERPADIDGKSVVPVDRSRAAASSDQTPGIDGAGDASRNDGL